MCFSSQRLSRSAVPTGGDIVSCHDHHSFSSVWYGAEGPWPSGVRLVTAESG